jgi:hypothetical protein
MTAISTHTKRDFLFYAVVVFLVAAGARFAFLAFRGPTLSPDSADFLLLAENIRTHGAYSLDTAPPFTPSIRRAPVYAFFLAALPMAKTNRAVAAAVLQVLLDAGVAVMVLLLALRSSVLRWRWSIAAGFAYAIFPGAIYASTTVLTEPLFTSLLVGGVLAAVVGFSKDRLRLTALAGVLLALAALCRPIALPIPVIFAGIYLLRKTSRRRWLHGAVLLGCTAAIMAPWAIRTTRVAEQLVVVNGASAVPFYVATRTDWDQKDQATLWTRFVNEDEYGRRLAAAKTPKEVAEADRVGGRMGLENIRANPRRYLSSRLRTLPYLVVTSFDNFTGINGSFRTLWQQGSVLKLALKLALLFLFSLVPFVLAWLGLIPGRRNLAALLVSVVWLYMLAANLPMWVEYRFWVPAIPFLLVTAAHGAQFLKISVRPL